MTFLAAKFYKHVSKVLNIFLYNWMGQGPSSVGSALGFQPLGPGFDSWPGSLCWMAASYNATSALCLIAMVPGFPISPSGAEIQDVKPFTHPP